MKRHFLSVAFSFAVALGISSLRAGDNKAPVNENGTATEEEESSAKNWIELGIGGINIAGDDAQFKQEHRMSGDWFGGIQDLHYEASMGKGTLTIDGRAIFSNRDYDWKIDFTQPGVGYVRGGYTEFRSWYDGNGGFEPVSGLWIPPVHPEDRLDRGEAWIELGLRMPKLPEITLHYSHLFRDGRKDSTIWGDTTLTFLPVNPARKIAPAFRDIDEKRDIFSAEILQNFDKTDLGLGMRYEHSETDNRLQLERGALQLPPLVAAPGAQRFITHRDMNESDSFNGHFTLETHLSDTLWFTAAYFYNTVSADIAGTRIIGSDYNSMYGDPILTLQSNDHGILNLSGVSSSHEHVGNLNLLWIPVKNLTALAAFRYTHEEKDSSASFLDTNTATNVAPFTNANPRGGFHLIAPVPRSGDTSDEFDNAAQTFELRYTGLESWVFYARGDWEEEWGNVKEHEVNAGTDEGMLNKDTEMFSQKYTAGVNWYPMTDMNFAGQYFHKSIDYDNDFKSELFIPPVAGAERNQRLLHQELDTDNFNIRMTWRPKLPPKMGTIAFVTRYDYVRATIDGRWAVSPTAVGTAPANLLLDEMRTAEITNHVFTETVTWNPCARLFLQGNFSYVKNETDTPVSDINLIPNTMPSVANSQNDYWTAGASAGLVIDDRTDLHVDYSYYRADNYEVNTIVGLPYGMDARQHTVGATVGRQISKNVRLKLQYGYFRYRDETSGGHNNYDAHAVFSSLQFRF
ncbi:MAG TPA: hypothetical protein VF751_00370 [Chthoniobacterales bacterium]